MPPAHPALGIYARLLIEITLLVLITFSRRFPSVNQKKGFDDDDIPISTFFVGRKSANFIVDHNSERHPTITPVMFKYLMMYGGRSPKKREDGML